MPTSFLSADTNFPRLTADQPVEERLGKIQNYLYMLLEELRYTLSNLGEENFNDETLKEMGETLTGPITQTVTDLAGNVSTLEQTATSITSRLNNFNGSSSTIEQTATALTTRLNDFNGSGSTIEQTATSLTTRVSNAEGDITTTQQTANKINWVVASGGTETTFELTSHMASLVSDEISIAGAVTLTDLQNPASEAFINGNNVLLKSNSTGNSGSSLQLINANDNAYGGLWTKNMTGSQNPYMDPVMLALESYGLVDSTYCGLLLQSGHALVAEGSTVNINGTSELALTSSNPIIIEGTGSYAYPAGQAPAGFYSFCSDGIYYGSTKILST